MQVSSSQPVSHAALARFHAFYSCHVFTFLIFLLFFNVFVIKNVIINVTQNCILMILMVKTCQFTTKCNGRKVIVLKRQILLWLHTELTLELIVC